MHKSWRRFFLKRMHTTYSHGTKNLYNYIKKARAGGLDLHGKPEIIAEGPAFAVYDANKTMGMISSYIAMQKAVEKAKVSGIALVGVKTAVTSVLQGIMPIWLPRKA